MTLIKESLTETFSGVNSITGNHIPYDQYGRHLEMPSKKRKNDSRTGRELRLLTGLVLVF